MKVVAGKADTIIVMEIYKIQNVDIPLKVSLYLDHRRSYKIIPAFVAIVVVISHVESYKYKQNF
jgi:hypothetical protein